MPAPLVPGQKLWFPNIVVRMVRSTLPPHQAVFRVPLQLNKFDIKDYLQNLYNISISDVRTMIYRPKYALQGNSITKFAGFKKAIVTMDKDFVWPEPLSLDKRQGALQLPKGRGLPDPDTMVVRREAPGPTVGLKIRDARAAAVKARAEALAAMGLGSEASSPSSTAPPN